LPKLELTGNAIRKQKPQSITGKGRPTSNFTKIQKEMGNQDPRFSNENVLHMELDMPERNTLDYQGEIHRQYINQVTEDVSKTKEFIPQDHSI